MASPQSSILTSPPVSPMSFCSASSVDHESSILAMAILAGNIDEVASLINVGVTLSERYNWTLYHACLQGVDMIRTLLGSSCTLNVPDDGHSILHYVLRTPSTRTRFPGGKAGVVHALMENGADPFEQDRLGETALHILAGMLEDIEMDLLRALLLGGDPRPWIECRNHYGDTALITAVICQNYEAARMLLQAGADPNAKGDFGGTAVQCATHRGDTEMIDLLVEFGAQVENDFEDEDMWE